MTNNVNTIEWENYKKETNFHARVEDSSRILCRHPDKIPLLCQRYNNGLEELEKFKYVVGRQLKVSEFISCIRKKLTLNSSQGIFLFLEKQKKVAPSSETVGNLYDQYKSDCGFLFLTYTGENVFG